jgi:ubiquinone/menaquinone biosynthesis C-methylase UbiE
MKFPESPLAHKYCIGEGIEIGAAAHNSFGLPNCIKVGIPDDEEFYRKHQVDMCGEYAEIEVFAQADKLPFPDKSKDYIITSHVVEHLQDLIGTFKEWNRVIKKDGIVFMIFPNRTALKEDIGRPLSAIPEFEYAHQTGYKELISTEHIWVFSLQTMVNLIDYCNNYHCLNWAILEKLEVDDKAGNGHEIIIKVN